VVMRVPEDDAHNWPDDMYVAHVPGTTTWDSVLRAQRRAADYYGKDYDEATEDMPNPDDFKVLVVTLLTNILQRGDVQ
jgi:hypothetical protein